MKTRKLALLTALMLLLTVFALAACVEKPEGETPSQETLNPVDLSIRGDVAGGVHIFNVTPTNNYLVKDGVTDYIILYPESADADTLYAVTELSGFVYQSTGAVLSSVEESQGMQLPAKFVSVGNTRASVAAGIVPDADIVGAKGFIIKSDGAQVYALGSTSAGTLNSVYELLHQLIEFEVYGRDSVYYTKGTDIKLANYDITDVPDIPFNVFAIGYLGSGDLLKRMRYSSSGWIQINNHGYHNSFGYLNPSDWFDTDIHPEWYSVGINGRPDQLCYLAHGDEESRVLMREEIIRVLKAHLIEFPELTRVALNQEDTGTWCGCDACRALKEEYGTDAVSVLRMVNEIDDAIQDWFESEEGSPYARDLDIAFFAYHHTTVAPVKQDAEGNYVPIDESVTPNKNICIFYAPINMEYNEPFESEKNQEYYHNLMQWGAISKRMYLWTYSTNFHYYLAPYNSFAAMQDIYKTLKEGNTYHLFDQNQYNATASTGFTALKGFLSYKLAWNVNLNINELICEFMERYYGPAASEMTQMFEALRTNFAYTEYDGEADGSIFAKALDKKLYSQSFLDMCIGYAEDALAALEPLRKENLDEYNRITKAVLLESLSYRYLLIELYPENFMASELLKMRQDFKADATLTGLNQESESKPLTILFSRWGV